VRLFVAGYPPAPVLAHLAGHSARLHTVRAGARVTRTDTWHVTLAFLGELPYWQLVDVGHAVELGAKVLSPTMAVGDFGSMAVCEDPTGAAFSFWQAGTHVGAQVTEDPGSAAWYELYSSNAKQARDFYMAVLGATVDVMPGDMEYYVLKHGDQQMCGIMQIDPTWGDFHSQWVTYFSVANTDETVAVVTKLGGKVMGPVDDSPFGRIAALMDPSGAAFKVVQSPAG